MSDNHWPDHHDDATGGEEHHGFEDAAADPGPLLPEPQDDAWHIPDDYPADTHHDTGWDHDGDDHAHLPAAEEGFGAEPEVHDTADDQHLAAETAEDVFPPALDVGPLPEPVDGWPWIDTSSLGLAHAGIVDQAMLDRMPGQDPAELAEYAAEDLPPGADPWAALAGSEDPATAALAEYYRPGESGTST